jgi:hypothetical protein
VSGSDRVVGSSAPACPGTNIIAIFDCGPERPPVCHDGTDQLIGTGSKRPDGSFDITVAPPLQPGQRIYPVDYCFTPPLVGPSALVTALAPAPALGPIGVLLALLVLVALAHFAILAGRRR